jgi:hypothetical protein
MNDSKGPAAAQAANSFQTRHPAHEDLLAALNTESHFDYCRARIGTSSSSRSTERRQTSAGAVEMTNATWRKLMHLVHPDRHHASQNEDLANEMTKWLLEQRPRLKG